MKHFEITGTLRPELGKKATKAIRKQGEVPCVLYGGKENLHFSVTNENLRKLVYSPHVYLVDIKIGKKTYPAVMKELQFDPVSDSLTHLDFLEVSEDKAVTISVPIIITGQSVGVKIGGKLNTYQRLIKVKALPQHLPDFVEIDITNLNIGQSVRVKNIIIENVEFIDNKNKVLVAVNAARGVDKAALAAETDTEATEE